MGELGILLLKGIVGGTFVVVFAGIGEVVRPRGLAGLTSGAPSVALGSLLLTVLATGAVAAWNQSVAMIAGAVALFVWCLIGTEAVKRFGALKGSVASTTVWLAMALGLWAVALR